MTKYPFYCILLMLHEYMCAALAQSVERRLGKAEVGGSIPLGSSEKNITKDFSKCRALESLYFVIPGSHCLLISICNALFPCFRNCDILNEKQIRENIKR